jgi:CheY-like chemotaxis protein
MNAHRAGGSHAALQAADPVKPIHHQLPFGQIFAAGFHSRPPMIPGMQAAAGATEPGRAAAGQEAAPAATRILFMDDDAQIRTLTKDMLEGLDYRCDLARDGTEALQLYQGSLRFGRPYDAVIMDLTIIGGMGGQETFHELRKLHPAVCAIIASGYDTAALARQFIGPGYRSYLSKPYRPADLDRAIRQALGK